MRIGLGSYLANQRGIDVSAPQPDVGADGAEDPAEGVGTLPCGRERGDGPAARTADRPIVAVVRELDRSAVGGRLLLDLGQEFVEEEPGVGVAEPVVFVAPVESVQGSRGRRLDLAGPHEDPDEDRDFFALNQAVEDLGGLVLDAILVDVDAGGLGGIVLLGDVDPVVAGRPGEDFCSPRRCISSPPPWEAPGRSVLGKTRIASETRVRIMGEIPGEV